MSRNHANCGPMKIALWALAATLFSGALFAEDIAQVTVTASRPTEKIVGRTSLGIPIKEVAISYKVSYADLDLATHSGAVALESRISDAARGACKELDKDYPLTMSGDKSCEKSARDVAMAKAHSVIADAEKNAHAK